MFKNTYDKLRRWQTARNSSYGKDISTPEARKEAVKHTNLVDHAWIRRFWTNMYKVDDQVWRSNQPGPQRFPRLREMGIRSIINLRGPSAFAVYLFEKEACDQHGITLYDHEIQAYTLDRPDIYLGLLELFERVEKPFLMHCKSGADRAGIASALYLMHVKGLSVDQARDQLAMKYVHRKKSKAGVLDAFLDAYARDTAQRPQSIRDWLASRYDRDAILEAFKQSRSKPGRI
ncbi:MAG TPA: protein tyrosine phosphatase [Aliiroseovarius sp.]|nr:protein tyrosine phosphatase [Aliiroseovarius sp.]